MAGRDRRGGGGALTERHREHGGGGLTEACLHFMPRNLESPLSEVILPIPEDAKAAGYALGHPCGVHAAAKGSDKKCNQMGASGADCPPHKILAKTGQGWGLEGEPGSGTFVQRMAGS